MPDGWAELRAKVTLPVFFFFLLLLTVFVALVAIFSKVFGMATGAGLMGATAALAFINARAEEDAEEMIEEETEEILYDHALQVSKRFDWMRWRFLGQKEEEEDNEDEQSPRVAGSPLPSEVNQLRDALQARLKALSEDVQLHDAAEAADSPEALDDEAALQLQRVVEALRENASPRNTGDASSSSEAYQASTLRRRLATPVVEPG